MANITDSSRDVAGPFNPTKFVLTVSDTLTWTPNANQELVMYNITGSPVVVTIDGSLGTTVSIPGTGGATFSVAAGLAVTVPANGFTVVMLDKIPNYLQGVVAVTGGVGIVAFIAK